MGCQVDLPTKTARIPKSGINSGGDKTSSKIPNSKPPSPSPQQPPNGNGNTPSTQKPPKLSFCTPHSILDPGKGISNPYLKPRSMWKVAFTKRGKLQLVVNWQENQLADPGKAAKVNVQFWDFNVGKGNKKTFTLADTYSSPNNTDHHITDMAFSPMDRFLGLSYNNIIRIYDLTTKKQVGKDIDVDAYLNKKVESIISEIKFDPNISTRVYAQTCFGSSNILKLDMKAGKVLHNFPLMTKIDHPVDSDQAAQTCRQSNFAFDPGTGHLGAYIFNKLKMWDLAGNGKRYYEEQFNDNLHGILFDPRVNVPPNHKVTMITWTSTDAYFYTPQFGKPPVKHRISIPIGEYNNFYKSPSSSLMSWKPNTGEITYVGKGNTLYNLKQKADKSWGYYKWNQVQLDPQDDQYIFQTTYSDDGKWLAFRTFSRVHLWQCKP